MLVYIIYYLKKELRHFFSMNFVEYFRTASIQDIYERVLLEFAFSVIHFSPDSHKIFFSEGNLG